MSELEAKAKSLAQIVGTLTKEFLGEEARFIYIPMINRKEGMEAAVVSSFKSDELCYHLGMIASQTIDKQDKQQLDTELLGCGNPDCDKCKKPELH